MELQSKRAEELTVQYQSGSRQAMEELIQEIQNGVYYHCAKILRNESDAQDAAQEVLMAVAQGLDGLKNPAAFHSWLNRIIARTCMKLCAKDHRETAVSENTEDAFFGDLDDQQIPEKIIDTEETRRMIRELVDGLPPSQRLCVLLYYYDELPVKDIAEAVGAPENTVKSRLSYARKSIKAGVDRWIAQGLTLYTFSPLPYLRYFLQKEAEDCRLPPALAARIQDALLAAGAAGAAAAGGGALAGAAAGGAAGAAAAGGGALAGGTVVMGLVHKGALALTGLLLAGGVGGLLLYHPPQQPDAPPEPDPPRVVETIPAPEEPEEVPPPEAPEPHAEEQAASVPAPPPAEEPPEESGGGAVPAPTPEEKPEPEEDSEPESDLDPEPEPAPEPPPEPEPEPEPEPPASGSPSIDGYHINYEFGPYLGVNEEGVHEFDLHIPANREEQPFPLEDGHYYIRVEISDETRVGSFGGYIFGRVPGTCEVRYYTSRNPEGPFALTVIAYVTVEPVEPVTPDYDWGGYEGTSNGVAYFSRTLAMSTLENKRPFLAGQFYVRVESSDDSVIKVVGTDLWAVGYGSAVVRYDIRWSEADPWVESVVVHVTVPKSPPPAAGVTERQTLRVCRGSNESFFDVWQGELPQSLRFTSSRASVVYVHPTGGGFSALAAGTSELTAYDPLRPNLHYVLEVQVDDAFAWEYTTEDLTVLTGKTQAHEIRYTVQSAERIRLSSVTAKSENPYVADITMGPDNMTEDAIRFEVTGLSQGTTEITGRAAFDVLTYDGWRRMETSFSVPVQVDNPPEDEIPTLSKELERFGIRSGYGYKGFFSSLWGEELPENLTYVSSDPAVAYINEYGTFSTLSAGTAVLTASGEAEPACRYALTLHVEDRFDCAWTEKTVAANPEFSNSTQSPNCEMPAGASLQDIEWTSSDPDLLTIIAGSSNGCSFKANRPGTASLNGTAVFRVSTTAGVRYMKDAFSLPVTVDYYMETEAVESGPFGFCSGYGYTGSFQDYFPDLPEGLSFSSSDLNVVSIHRDGSFTTLKPGRVVLTARTEFSPTGHQYAVWLTVQDAMDWTYSLEEVELDVGGSVLCGVTDPQLNSGVELRYAYWYAADSRVVSVTKDTDDPLRCRLEAKQPGTTTVTGWLTIEAPSYLYGTVSPVSLSVTVSFPVTVREPEEADPGTPPDAP